MGAGGCSRPTFFPSKSRAEGYVSAVHLRTPEVAQQREAGRVVVFAVNGGNGHCLVFVGDLLKKRMGRFGESHVPVSELTRGRGLVWHFGKLVMQAGALYPHSHGSHGRQRPIEVLKELLAPGRSAPLIRDLSLKPRASTSSPST